MDDLLIIVQYLNDFHKDMIPEITNFLHESYAPLKAQGLNYVAATQDESVTESRLSEGKAFLGFLDDELVATVSLLMHEHNVNSKYSQQVPYFMQPHVAAFSQFAVKHHLKGQGLGQKMMAYIEAKARQLGAKELALDTSEKATDLIAFYKKRGYQIVAEHDWEFTNYKSLILSKNL